LITSLATLDRTTDQDGATADEDDRQRGRARLHTVHSHIDGLLDHVERTTDQVLVQTRDSPWFAHIDVACRDCDVCGRQRVTTEDQAARDQLIADGVRADAHGPVRAHETATTESKRVHVRHAEVGPHSANDNGKGGFTWEAVRQHADVRRRSANVDHHRFLYTGQKRRTAHAIRRTRGERQHRVLLGKVGAHQRAIVLADVERRVDMQTFERGAEGIDNALGEICEARIHDRCVLALQQANPTNFVRQCNEQPGHFLAEDFRGALLHVGIHR
jgi:hypothetical protein